MPCRDTHSSVSGETFPNVWRMRMWRLRKFVLRLVAMMWRLRRSECWQWCRARKSQRLWWCRRSPKRSLPPLARLLPLPSALSPWRCRMGSVLVCLVLMAPVRLPR